MKIYTKTGDDGTTGLIGGMRVPKYHVRVESYGNVDELNSAIGIVRSTTSDAQILESLALIQDRLFTVGSYLAAAPGNIMVLPQLQEEDISMMEKEIDRMTAMLPELKNFILPGGSTPGSYAHLARCICRRAERWVVHLVETETIDPLVIHFLNRLSDYLFTLARFLDMQNGGVEIAWRPRNK
jgi:cob(I)alamin adenosyltransferase